MNQPNVDAYCELMTEIRHRADAISAMQVPNREYVPDFVRVECLVLQVRKILELVALGSLVFNVNKYKEAYASIEKHSNARLIIRDLEKINPEFYPRPAEVSKSPQEGVNHHMKIIENPDDSYLCINEFIKIYEKCGGIMHAQNPYGSSRDYGWYESNIRGWMEKISNLLKIHVIRLVDDENHYLIQVNAPDGQAHGYTLSPNIQGI